MHLPRNYNRFSRPRGGWVILLALVFLQFSPRAAAQVTDSTEVTDSTQVSDATQVNDTTAVQADSVKLQPVGADTLKPAGTDTLPQPAARDTVRRGSEGGRPGAQAESGSLQEGEVRFQATDSLVFDFRDDRVANLYGSSKVNHNAGKLESGKVALNFDKNEVRASTQNPQDTLAQPVLTREGEPPLRSEKIAFNYQTEKGRFDVAQVEISQGKLTGTKVKNTGPHTVFLEDAIYSTCTLDHPHYYISMDRAKVIKEDGREEVFFKNARLYILDIPYPIVFPFGYFPGNMEQKQSGILEPTYVSQNTSSRGLGLRNVGWFQYFNDYIVGQASVDIFTSGTFFLDTGASYRNRDKYNGSIDIGYSRERGLEPTDPDFSIRTARSIRITHSQDFSPFASLSANINLETSNYDERNSFDINQRAETSTRSSINYRYRHPDNLYNFSASMQQNQNFLTNTTRVRGPSFDFSLQRLTPFSGGSSQSGGQQDPKWYESLSLQYRNSFESEFEFQPEAGESADINWFEALLDPSKYRQATDDTEHYKYGFRQDADVSLNNLLESQYLNLSANANLTEYWYPTTIRRSFDADSGDVVDRQVRGFATARDFSTSLNFSTTFYGISNAKIGNIEGFRHTVRPTMSLSYRPDFSSDFFGYYREYERETTDTTTVEQYSIFENEVFGGPGSGEQRAVNFGISNVFEAKQVKRDSTGEKSEEVLRLIDQLNLSSSYNFAADSLKLADMNASLTSSIVPGISIRASANFNFYERDSQGTKIDNYLLTNSGRFAELTNFSISSGYSFNWGPRSGFQSDENPYFPARYDPLNQSLFNEMDPAFNRRPVQKVKSPFSFSVNFQYRWRLNSNPLNDNTKSATINAQNIEFQLTPKWSFGTQLGYDFVRKELTPSEFRLNRQLHEWQLSFQMRPFGDFQYYFFSLRINSSQIQSIFQKLPLLKNLERSSSPTGRGIGRY
jgi:hypothetical protein